MVTLSTEVNPKSRREDHTMPALISRDALERHQVWFYLVAAVLGLLVGSAVPGLGYVAEGILWPVLALLLYVTFVQMPLAKVPAAFADVRFLVTALIGNFVLVPLLVWSLVQMAPNDDAFRIGLLLVLLVPCTDWFITFTQLGGGDGTRAIVLTPILLILQLLLLPVYLGLMTGINVAGVFAVADVWPALLVVLIPLSVAAVTESWAKRRNVRRRVVQSLGWWPVPLLAVVIFLIAVAQVRDVMGNLNVLPVVIGISIAFLASVLVLAKLLGTVARLPTAQGRTLTFSMGTRNSFIVLPFALSLPAGWEIAAIVIVMQAFVELFGMAFCLWFVPRVLFRDRATTPQTG